MGVTFLIGNGFDLNLGMKTRYTDMYDSYIKSKSKSTVIDKFKKDLQKEEHNHYENWSDFEIALTEYAKTFANENEMIECVRDFKGCMVSHLIEENNKISELINKNESPYIIVTELNRSFENFYEGLTPNDINLIKSVMAGSVKVINYITFNYTSTLEMLLELDGRKRQVFENTPIHIHGNLEDSIVLGVDNLEQLKDVPFPITIKGARAFVKTVFNEQFDKNKIALAKQTITKSDIICVFGFSMSDTDKMWVDSLTAWLLENEKHQLIVYQYEDKEYHNYNYDEIMDIEDERKIQLLDKLGIESTNVLEQLHIPVGRKIFNFKFVKTTSQFRPIG